MSHVLGWAAEWARTSATTLLSVATSSVFLCLDSLEVLFCILYRYLDYFFEGKVSPCYCEKKGDEERNVGDGEGQGENDMSETLYGIGGRRNWLRDTGFLRSAREWEDSKKGFGGGGGGGSGSVNNRWSDCGCESCVSWMKLDQKLHLVVREPSRDANADHFSGDSTDNVIFLHGFMSSSSFWTETVFPHLSKSTKRNCRLFAVDLLGFGQSPKPRDCLYTLRDHLEMIEKTVTTPFQLKSFHLVAHSMGCIIALALAAKYSTCVKSVTLVAPPYFPSFKGEASLTMLHKLAGKRVWPPLLFGSSFMSWYEHLGRCVCLLICRNHRMWEGILKLLTWRRDLHFMIRDLTRHTHHSAWHTMHNVLCRGGTLMDEFLETLIKCGVKICVLQGDRDVVVPLECSNNIKMKVPNAEVSIISNADHCSVILGREKDFTQSLEHVWASFSCIKSTMD